MSKAFCAVYSCGPYPKLTFGTAFKPKQPRAYIRGFVHGDPDGN